MMIVLAVKIVNEIVKVAFFKHYVAVGYDISGEQIKAKLGFWVWLNFSGLAGKGVEILVFYIIIFQFLEMLSMRFIIKI
jgi:hypothetical protein